MNMAQIQKPVIARYHSAPSTTHEVQPEGAQQDYQAHAIVQIASGKIEEIANNADAAANGVYGIDTIAASGTEDTDRRPEVLTTDCEVKMTVYHSTPANAVTAQAQVGVQYGVTLQTVHSGSEPCDSWSRQSSADRGLPHSVLSGTQRGGSCIFQDLSGEGIAEAGRDLV
jgi:hypothetical protein